MARQPVIVNPPLPAGGILIAQNLQLTQEQLDAIRRGAIPFYRVYGSQGYRTVGSHGAARQEAIIAHGEPVLSIMTLKAVRSLPGASLAAINTQSTALAAQDIADASGGFYRDALIGGAIFLTAGVAGAAALSAGAAGSGAGVSAAATDTSITAASTSTTSTLTNSAITDAFGAGGDTAGTLGAGAGGDSLTSQAIAAAYGPGSDVAVGGAGGSAFGGGIVDGSLGAGAGSGSLGTIASNAGRSFLQGQLAKLALKYAPHPPASGTQPSAIVGQTPNTGGIDPILLALGSVAAFLIF